MTHVSLYHLTHQYTASEPAAVNDLSLEIPSGEVTALLGPSGSGKSTTLKMVAGLLGPSSGDICFAGATVVHLPPEQREAAMVFQNHLLFPFMNVADNVGFGLRMRGHSRAAVRQRVDEMLAVVQLPGFGHRMPDELSGGQAQRVALARALVIEPRVLLLDEPLSNLDAHLRDEMRALILEVQRRFSITTIVVTHDQQEAVVLARQIALLFEGRLAQWGEARALFERPRSVEVARFFGGSNFVPGRARGGGVETPLGTFTLPDTGGPSGEVMLTVRPEKSQLRPLSAQDRPNHFPAEVVESLYRGTDARFRLRAATFNFEVITPASQAYDVRAGERVAVYFPKEAIWTMATHD